MLKYVVPKPSRRSPVINRAYFQRTESIRCLVEGWIKECEALGLDECAVISLGCGFDPTFFRLQTLRNHRSSRTKLKYIDIDYPTLIMERLYMVRNQDKLFELLPEDPTRDDVDVFVSDTYSCLGVDLRKLDQLETALKEAGIIKNGTRMPILVVSEVVLAYLEADESDAVIRFFSAYPEATFILHEQCIPTFDIDQEREQENLHPFGLTMFRHFERTMTPLKTLREYRSIEDHRDRFYELGWPSCDIFNMNLMNDLLVMPNEDDHHRVLQLEPFDEYDEQFWIGSYYFIAVASTGPGEAEVPTRSPDVLRRIGLRSKLQHMLFEGTHHIDESSYVSLDTVSPSSSMAGIPVIDVKWSGQHIFPDLDINRKGHTVSILGDEAFVFGGFGLDAVDHQEDQRIFHARAQQTRLGSTIRINLTDGSSERLVLNDNGPAPRMHHSVATSLDGSAFYIYGGREGPTKVFNDVWRFTAQDQWTPLWLGASSHSVQMPEGRFKHTANMMTVAGRELMVVVGGRSESGDTTQGIWAFDIQDNQWTYIPWENFAASAIPSPIFSHSAVVVKDENQQDDVLILIGGIQRSDEKVVNSVRRVSLRSVQHERLNRDILIAHLTELDIKASSDGYLKPRSLKPRFGHTSIAVDHDRIWVLGGVSAPGLLQWQETMVEIQLSTGTFRHLRPSSFRELVMVGHATAIDRSRNRIIGVGGGGTCFGFGAWWDAVAWALQV
ncbi:Leucine carboxyl methyltransferase 2 [Mortierella claussenii]|nr:Leucine carboxyl methyltransferase 2 [Mortierella claussenii]